MMLKSAICFFLLATLACNSSKSDNNSKKSAAVSPEAVDSQTQASREEASDSSNSANSGDSTGSNSSSDTKVEPGKFVEAYLFNDDGACGNIIGPEGKSLAEMEAAAEVEMFAGSCPTSSLIGGQAATVIKTCDYVYIELNGLSTYVQYVLYSKQKGEGGLVSQRSESDADAYCQQASEASIMPPEDYNIK